jgi:hypothetical protein
VPKLLRLACNKKAQDPFLSWPEVLRMTCPPLDCIITQLAEEAWWRLWLLLHIEPVARSGHHLLPFLLVRPQRAQDGAASEAKAQRQQGQTSAIVRLMSRTL